MLFDLATDPHEQDNVAEQHPGVLREAAYRLLEWHDTAMAGVVRDCSDVVDPMYTVLAEGGPLHGRAGRGGAPKDMETYFKRLEDSGRADAARRLRETDRYPVPAEVPGAWGG